MGLIHEKNQRLKISRYCPINILHFKKYILAHFNQTEYFFKHVELHMAEHLV